MVRSARQSALSGAELLTLSEPVGRYLARYTTDPDELADLTQETLARVWEARRRVDRSVAASYAIATARNLVLSGRRQQLLHQRHQHRLLEPPSGPQPEENALGREERQAAAAALEQLSDPDRELLHRHYLPPADPPTSGSTATTAIPATTTPTRPGPAAEDPISAGGPARRPGETSRLARARARARVNYLLVLRRLELPTRACRPVLDALSAGDRRQQRRVDAAGHLVSCQVCADCAPALLGRRRVLFGILPAPLLLALDPLRRAFGKAPRTTTAATAAGVVAVAAAVAFAGSGGARPTPAEAGAALPTSSVPAPITTGPSGPGSAPPSSPAAPPPAPSDQVTVGAQVVPAGQWGTGQVTGTAGAVVQVNGVPVQSVPADEGFWVGVGTDRFWVQLAEAGESPQQVKAGDLVTLTGTARAVTAASAPGLTPAEGRDQLVRQGGYLWVDPADLHLQRPAGS